MDPYDPHNLLDQLIWVLTNVHVHTAPEAGATHMGGPTLYAHIHAIIGPRLE